MSESSASATSNRKIAVTALLLGIASLLTFPLALSPLDLVLGLLAVVVGVIGLRRLRGGASTADKVMALVGIVMGALPVAFFGLLVILYSFG
jgi:hypothetical protein